jgi:hypothetical protein
MNNIPAEQIILRRKPMARRTSSAEDMNEAVPGADTLSSFSEPILENVQLTPREIADTLRDPEVQIIASPMPLKLIEPVSASEQTPAVVHLRDRGWLLQCSILESTRVMSPFKVLSWYDAISPKARTMTRMVMARTALERFSAGT